MPVIVLWLGALCPPLSAQDATGPPPLWAGKAELSLVAATGNSETQTIGAGGEVEYRPDSWDVLLQARGVHSADRQGVRAESLAALTRGSHALSDGFRVFGQVNFLRNTFAGIGRRVALEGGISYALLPDSGTQALELRGGLGYLHERHTATPTTRSATSSAGARYRWRVSEHSEVTEEIVTTANLANAADWRLAHNASITAAVTAGVSLKITQQVDFRNTPEPGLRQTDTLTSAAVVVAF